MTTTTPPRRRSRYAPLALLVALLVGTVALTLALRAAVGNEEHRLLHGRAGEVAALLSSSVASEQSSLSLLGSVYAASPDPGRWFESSARTMAVPGGHVGIAQEDAGQFVVRSAFGSPIGADRTLPAAWAALAHRAVAAKDLVSTIIPAAGGRPAMLAYVYGRLDGLVVYTENPIAPDRLIASTRNSPFNELNGAIYVSPSAQADNVLGTTTKHLPLRGYTDSRTVNVGADRWLLVVASRRPLAGSFPQKVPWIILVVGAVAAFVVAGVFELLLRRRAYALALVDQRTAALRRTLDELEAARAAAESASSSKNEFLSRMSHELRTPLNSVLGFTQILELDELTDDQRESLAQITKGGNHLLELINEVLDIARIEAGDLALSPEPVLVDDVVTDVLDLVRPLAAQRSISIAAVGPTDRYVFADRQRLKQILLNLVSNAVKYNRPGGSVTVDCHDIDETRRRIRVSDTGPGIDPDQRHKLFEPFERLGAEQSNIEGTGVGLALSRRLADAMGATLDVDSTFGEGSTFWIELGAVEGPLERHDRLHGDRHTRTPSVGAQDRAHVVLSIEDNLANVKLIERVFAHRQDIKIVPAIQGRVGLDLARQLHPALILLDVHLPDIGGEVVLDQLRRDPTTAHIPVVVVSADATAHQIERLLAAGAFRYLTKPIDVQELLDLVDQLVAPASLT
jgi:signal transduction histidine kinase/ActR/RegA family two-component response regulator